MALSLVWLAASAKADSHQRASCTRALKQLGVPFKKSSRPGVAQAVEITGPIAGVEYRGSRKRTLVLDCSLVYSLARASVWFRQLGVTRVTYSSAYQRRNVRGTNRRSNHAYGLALDVHTFSGDEVGDITVVDDYEQGLGDDVDCIGAPLTERGALLRIIDCQMTRSALFRSVLTPDYDADHHNHFHLDALPWNERTDRIEVSPTRSATARGSKTSPRKLSIDRSGG